MLEHEVPDAPSSPSPASGAAAISDAALARLRERVERIASKLFPMEPLTVDEVRAVLARLGAAEAALREPVYVCVKCHTYSRSPVPINAAIPGDPRDWITTGCRACRGITPRCTLAGPLEPPA